MGIPVTERAIHVYTCMNDRSRKCIALIDGINMIFRGENPLKARKEADDWRRESVSKDKLLTKERKAELLGESVD